MEKAQKKAPTTSVGDLLKAASTAMESNSVAFEMSVHLTKDKTTQDISTPTARRSIHHRTCDTSIRYSLLINWQ